MKPFRALQFACSHLVAQPVGLPEQDVPRIQAESWERSRNRPEPTGFGSSVTNFSLFLAPTGILYHKVQRLRGFGGNSRYCHWIWWRIQPTPANAFSARRPLIRLN